MEIVLDEEQKEKVKVYNSLMSQIISWSSFDKNDANAGTRFINGGTGECAIVEHLGEKWSPYTFGGSFLNNYPDLLPYNLNLGVKTARINTRHIVRYSDTTSEILCGITNQKSIVPIGILTPEMTRLYGTTDGLNGDLKYTNKEKVCFSKYDVLKPIQWDKLKAEYSTGIIVKFENENITDEILKDAVYFEQINDEYITYCIVKNGIVTEKGLVYFCYRKFFNNKDENIKGLCKLIDLCRNRMVFVFGMSGVIHQMQEMNEYTLKEKCVIRVVDVFKMLEKFDKGILGDIALFSVYDYSNSVEKSLNTLIRRYNCVYNENITEYIMRNCVKCFKIYKILCN